MKSDEIVEVSGAQLTHHAVRQVTGKLWAPQFDLRLIHENISDDPPVMRMLTQSGLTDAATIGFLRAKNAHGYNVYFRPVSGEFVLVDDVCLDALDAMQQDGIRTAAEIETSKANFQAWIRIADRYRPVDRDTSYRIARYLAQTYGGDMRSAKPEQLGRLPGFRNRKGKHRDVAGGFPLVLVRRAVFTGPQNSVIERALSCPLPPSPRSASALDATGSEIMAAPITDEQAAELWTEALADLQTKFGVLPTDDRSAIDFSVARQFKLNGIEPEIAAKIMLLNSAKARDRGSNYVSLTIGRAYGGT